MAVLGGLGAILLVGGRFSRLGTQPTKKLWTRKNVKILFFVAVPTSPFLSKTERFWPLVPPIGAVRTEKTSPFSGFRRGGPKSLLGLPLFLTRVRFSAVLISPYLAGSQRSSIGESITLPSSSHSIYDEGLCDDGEDGDDSGSDGDFPSPAPQQGRGQGYS